MLLHNFLIIEGNIGAGKTTLSSKLSEQFNTRLILEQFADNAFLPKFYKNKKKYAFPLELSFLAERYQQLKTELLKNDLFQPNVISDYYFLKSLIFAKTNLDEDEYNLFSKLFFIIYESLPKPDLFVYLYFPIERLQFNIKKRGRPYEQGITNNYLNKIQFSYLEFIKQLTDLKILILDANNLDFVNKTEDYNTLCEIINKPYNVGVTRIIA